MKLSATQQAHISKAFPESRDQLADYLARGVEVVIYRQNECWGDVPPFAVSPVENPEFWIGCWDTVELASAKATSLGLRIASVTQ